MTLEAREPQTGRLTRGAAGVGLAVAAALGVFGRLYGLGEFPLAVDEYYFIQSVKSTLEHGLPWFETGGYYHRGLLLQYLTGASVLQFGDGGFAYRLPAALFSLGTVPLAYIYGKRLLGGLGGVALAVLLLVSAWEIEFGRFARMYSALQFFTLLFLIAVDKASHEQNRRWTYMPHVTVLVTSFVHEFAILLVPFLFLPAMTLRRGSRMWTETHGLGFLLVTSAVALTCYFIFKFDPGMIGVTNPYPADVQLVFGSPWILPALPFFDAAHANALLRVGGGLAGAIVLVFVVLRALGRSLEESDLLGGLLILFALLHQFLVASLIGLFMLARYRGLDVGPQKRRLYVMLSAAAGLAVFWTAYASASQEWIDSTFSPDYALPKALVRTFFGWPAVLDVVVRPWVLSLPLLTVCGAGAFVYQIATKAKSPLTTWVRNPAVVITAVVLAFGVHATEYSSIRYSFFIYPVVLALILLSATEAATAVVRRLGGDERLGSVIGVVACVLMFVASSDFHLRQITGVAERDVRLRMGEFEPYQAVWYARWDFESPAVFIQERSGFRDGDKVLVVDQPPVSFYLRVPHAVYYERKENRFNNVSRAGGTIDRWSNQRLLSTRGELQEYTECTANVWIVRAVSAEQRPFKIEDVWNERHVSTTEVFRSVDGRLAVVRAELAPGHGC